MCRVSAARREWRSTKGRRSDAVSAIGLAGGLPTSLTDGSQQMNIGRRNSEIGRLHATGQLSARSVSTRFVTRYISKTSPFLLVFCQSKLFVSR